MTTINNFFKPQIANKKAGETQLSVFYTNDMHGDINRLSKLKTAKDSFENFNKNNSTLAMTAGDCFYGKNKDRLSLISKVMNLMKFDAMALGNHEFAIGSKGLSEQLKNINATSISANLDIGKDCPLQERIADKKLVKSAVFMKGGHKFAVIGASPFDADVGVSEDAKSGVRVKDIDKTIKAINEEAKNLEKQGINKIILCSHLGYGEHADLKVARETEGVDIIIGGHSHTTIEGVNTEDKGGNYKLNLVNSKRNEPVIITQAGKLNKYVGFLDVVFDKNGVIKTDSVKNDIADVSKFAEDKVVNDLMTETLGEKKHLANVVNDYDPECEFEERYTENPVANHYGKALMKAGKSQGVQVALFTTMDLKKGAVGEVTNYNVKFEMLPYNSDIVAIDMTEKDVVALLNITGSKVFSEFDPPLLRCEGMKYTLDQKYSNAPLTKLNLTDEDGNITATIDVKNPSETKKIRVAIDDYLLKSAPYSKDILAKYVNGAIHLGSQQSIFTDYLEREKTIDCAKPKDKKIEIKYNDLEKFCPQYSMDDKIKTLNKA